MHIRPPCYPIRWRCAVSLCNGIQMFSSLTIALPSLWPWPDIGNYQNHSSSYIRIHLSSYNTSPILFNIAQDDLSLPVKLQAILVLLAGSHSRWPTNVYVNSNNPFQKSLLVMKYKVLVNKGYSNPFQESRFAPPSPRSKTCGGSRNFSRSQSIYLGRKIIRAQSLYGGRARNFYSSLGIYIKRKLYTTTRTSLHSIKSHIQYMGWSSEFFQVPEPRRNLGIFPSFRNMKKCEGIMKKYEGKPL